MDKSDVKVGTRWMLRRDVERYPHFIADEGMRGTVTDASDSSVCLKMDEHLSGAEEWDNEVVWSSDDDESAEHSAFVPFLSACAPVLRVREGTPCPVGWEWVEDERGYSTVEDDEGNTYCVEFADAAPDNFQQALGGPDPMEPDYFTCQKCGGESDAPNEDGRCPACGE